MPLAVGHKDIPWVREVILSNARVMFPQYSDPASFNLDIVIALKEALLEESYAAIVAKDTGNRASLVVLERSANNHVKVEGMMNELMRKTARGVHQKLLKAVTFKESLDAALPAYSENNPSAS